MITNLGPSQASDSKLIVSFDEVVEDFTVYSTSGSCAQSSSGVECELDGMNPDQLIEVLIQTRGLEKAVGYSASVVTDGDSNGENNVVSGQLFGNFADYDGDGLSNEDDLDDDNDEGSRCGRCFSI